MVQLSLAFLCSRKPAHEGNKERYPVKVVILPLLASLSWKRLQIGMGMLPITTSTSDELFSRINIDDFERLWTSTIRVFKIDFLRSSAAARSLRMNCDEMAWDMFANRNRYRLSLVSWALAHFFVFCGTHPKYRLATARESRNFKSLSIITLTKLLINDIMQNTCCPK